MTKIAIRELVFNSWNKEHIRKHQVTEDEIKEAGQRLVYHKRSYKGRYLAIGRCGERLIAMVIRHLAKGKYYLVTARDASKKERREAHEKESK